MTDLERARLTYGVIRDFGGDVLWRSDNPIPDDAWPIDIIANALAAARREGAAEMRERAAQTADAASELMADSDIQFGSISGVAADLAKDLADAIRALPLTPEER